jgi:hypothetical protein
MKIIYTIGLLFLVLISSVSFKNRSPEATTPKNTAIVEIVSETLKSETKNAIGGYLTCKVDGSPLQAAYPGTMILFVPAKKEVTIWGKTPTGIISIIIDNVETIGTFAIKGNSKNGAGIMNGTKMFEVKKTGTPFTVTIESIDALAANNSTEVKAIRGTFQGKLMDQDGNMIEITEGKFSTQ